MLRAIVQLKTVVQQNRTKVKWQNKNALKQKRVSCHHSLKTWKIVSRTLARKLAGIAVHGAKRVEETAQQWAGRCTGLPVRCISRPCGWRPTRQQHRRRRLQTAGRSWPVDRWPSHPNNGVCLPAMESETGHHTDNMSWCTRILENCKVPVGTTVLAALAVWLLTANHSLFI